jgi:hypothetical protein
MDNDAAAGPELVDAAENEHEADSGLESRNGEVWEADSNEDEDEDREHELEEELQDLKSHVRDWSDLRKQIKELLKNQGKILPLSQVNQPLILSNFATLCLKGVSRTQASLEIAQQWHEGQGHWFSRRVRALARHYQVFETLPIQKCGGSANSQSWLHDKRIQTHTRDWLTSHKTGLSLLANFNMHSMGRYSQS